MYFVIANIPFSFKCSDLRNFFSYFIEQEAFQCFHFCHRRNDILVQYFEDNAQIYLCNPAIGDIYKEIVNGIKLYSETSIISASLLENNSDIKWCCILSVKPAFAEGFKSTYHKKFWVNRVGRVIQTQCLIFDIQPIVDLHNLYGSKLYKEVGYLTKKKEDIRNKEIFLDKIDQMVEFKMGLDLPHGNIGTTSAFLKQQLQLCKLSPILMKKLELDFMPNRRKKNYKQAHLDYKTDLTDGIPQDLKPSVIFTGNGDLIPGYFDIKFNRCLDETQNIFTGPVIETIQGNESEEEDIEEWERVEDSHEERRHSEISKDKLYEPKIEQVWEKGGPGLVWYTDAQFWRAVDSESEESDVDDWDTQGYNDVDKRDLESLIDAKKQKCNIGNSSLYHKADEKRRDVCRGIVISESPTAKTKSYKNVNVKKKSCAKGTKKQIVFGEFEKHTKRIGRCLMESCGWRDGSGLGRLENGMIHPLDQVSSKYHLERVGLGYITKVEPSVATAACSSQNDLKTLLPNETYPYLIQFQKKETLFDKRRKGECSNSNIGPPFLNS